MRGLYIQLTKTTFGLLKHRQLKANKNLAPLNASAIIASDFRGWRGPRGRAEGPRGGHPEPQASVEQPKPHAAADAADAESAGKLGPLDVRAQAALLRRAFHKEQPDFQP